LALKCSGCIGINPPLFEETLKLQEAILRCRHPRTLLTVANLGVNYKDARRLTEALPLLEESYRASKAHPSVRCVGQALLDGYVQAGKTMEAAMLVTEFLADARTGLPKDSPQLARVFVQFALILLDVNEYADAAPILRECLAIREKQQPDAWTTFNTKSLLGEALLGQKKYADAETLLLTGYEGMKQREKTIPPLGKDRPPKALNRLVELYTAMNKPEEVKKWQAERAKYPVIAPMPREKK